MASDYKEVKNWFIDDGAIPEYVRIARQLIETTDFDLKTTDRASSALYKGVLCLIAKEGARDFLNGNPPEFSLLNDHHIFPKSKANQYQEGKFINSILNRTLIAESTNKNYIKAKTPPEYIEKISKDQNINQNVLASRFTSHFIDKSAFESLLQNDLSKFFQIRDSIIRAALKKLIY